MIVGKVYQISGVKINSVVNNIQMLLEEFIASNKWKLLQQQNGTGGFLKKELWRKLVVKVKARKLMARERLVCLRVVVAQSSRSDVSLWWSDILCNIVLDSPTKTFVNDSLVCEGLWTFSLRTGCERWACEWVVVARTQAESRHVDLAFTRLDGWQLSPAGFTGSGMTADPVC